MRFAHSHTKFRYTQSATEQGVMQLIIGYRMPRKYCILFALLLIIGCSASQKTKRQSGWLSDNEPMIARTKQLIACSKFFSIVDSQRTKEREKYSDLASQAEKLAYEIMPAYKEGNDVVKSELTGKYNRHGNYTATEWVKSIGNDKTGDSFPKITQNCYETLKLEDLIETVDDLNKKIKQRQ